MSTAPAAPTRARPSAWWLVLPAVLVPCLYLPTLATRFDFADDGALVYPRPAHGLAQHAEVIWHDTLADYRSKGPFRPLTWAHWDAAAWLLGPNDFARRLARFAWSILAAGALAWLLAELRLRPAAVALTTALAMWNPYRGEIWMGLGLTEAFAMPYALAGLACATRAARAARPLGWDVGAVLCLLAALCVKNTFAALLPAQILLRLTASGLPLRAGWCIHRRRCAWYLAALALPAAHFLLLKLHPQQEHYATGFTPMQLPRMVRAVAGAVSIEYMAPGLALAALALWAGRAIGPLRQYQLALRTALLLLVCGVGIYLPIDGIAGRYTMPAVWGADVALAVLLSALAGAPGRFWKRLAFAAIGCGLLAVAVANVGRQQKVAARNALLWQALEYLERRAPGGATVAWVGTPEVGVATRELAASEGYHFRAHLRCRGHTEIKVAVREPHDGKELPALVLSGTPLDDPAGEYRLLCEFRAGYWAGRKCFRCYLWERRAAGHR